MKKKQQKQSNQMSLTEQMSSTEQENKKRHTSGYYDVKKVIDRAEKEVKVSVGLHVGFFADDRDVGRSWQNILDRASGEMNNELYNLIYYIRDSGLKLTWRYNFIWEHSRSWAYNELNLSDWVRKEMAAPGDNLYIYWDYRIGNDVARFGQLARSSNYGKITLKITNSIYAEVKNEIEALGLKYELILFDDSPKK